MHRVIRHDSSDETPSLIKRILRSAAGIFRFVGLTMARPTLRILCFGDSLTAGYSVHGGAYHPYAEKLAQMISMALPHVDIEAVEDGKPGDMVRAGFYERMRRRFRKTDKPFDWTIVLGGTK
jgi:lysophospholipase L1-like esterase